MAEFRREAFAASDRQGMSQAMGPEYRQRAVANANYGFEHELRQYTASELDLPKLRAVADHILPAGGQESHGYPAFEAIKTLAKRLGRELIELPGDHLGFATQPREFAESLLERLLHAEAEQTSGLSIARLSAGQRVPGGRSA